MMGTIRVPAPGVFAMGFAFHSKKRECIDGGRKLAINTLPEFYRPADASSSEIAAS